MCLFIFISLFSIKCTSGIIKITVMILYGLLFLLILLYYANSYSDDQYVYDGIMNCSCLQDD